MKVPWTGLRIPYGARVEYLPSEISPKPTQKMDPVSKTGVFLGYLLQPGHVWKGEYKVAALESFVGRDLHRDAPAGKCTVGIETIRTIIPQSGEWIFPLVVGYHFQVNGGVSCATLRAQCEPLENPAGVIFDLDPQNQGATRIHKLRGREPGKRTTNGQETGTREDMLRGVVVAGRGKLKNTYKVACITERLQDVTSWLGAES